MNYLAYAYPKMLFKAGKDEEIEEDSRGSWEDEVDAEEDEEREDDSGGSWDTEDSNSTITFVDQIFVE
uniref:Uncharacterized protein n=1 Tax=Panagrolaimus sp. JU765 TaxID=591449 RepID=A0AC34R0R5_9BILA